MSKSIVVAGLTGWLLAWPLIEWLCTLCSCDIFAESVKYITIVISKTKQKKKKKKSTFFFQPAVSIKRKRYRERQSECGASSSTSLRFFFFFFWGGSLHGSGMSHLTTASPKLFFRAPWRVGDAMVGRGNAGWTTSKSGHPAACQSYEVLLPKRLEENLCWVVPQVSPQFPDHGTELNWTELN